MSGNGIVLGNGNIKLSLITTDKVHGHWWAIGTDKQWMEIRITKAGKIKPSKVRKKKHPYFTLTSTHLTPKE